MKNIYIFLFILIIPFNKALGYSNYYLSDSETTKAQAAVEYLENIISDKSDYYRNIITDKIKTIIENNEYSESSINILKYVYDNLIHSSKDELIELDKKPINFFQQKNDEEANSQEQEDNNTKQKTDNTYYLNNTYQLENTDITSIIENWLSRNNEVREELWVNDYWYEYTLEKSALSWSQYSLEKWEITHQRFDDSSYYDYDEITSRFAEQWVVCENIEWITNTENIRWWGYTCSDWECTDELDASVLRAFENYMAEEWTDSDAHYRSIIQEYFNYIWVWIQIDQINDTYFEYYLTINYCTNLE